MTAKGGWRLGGWLGVKAAEHVLYENTQYRGVHAEVADDRPDGPYYVGAADGHSPDVVEHVLLGIGAGADDDVQVAGAVDVDLVVVGRLLRIVVAPMPDCLRCSGGEPAGGRT